MNLNSRRRLSFGRFLPHLALLLVIAMAVGLVGGPVLPSSALVPEQDHSVFLPLVFHRYPWPSAFGVEVNRTLQATLADRAGTLGAKWVRLGRVSWREIQPAEGGPYDWGSLSTLEDELRTARDLGITPVVVVQHSPRWATINEPLETDCGAIRADKFDAFASFMAALAARYSTPEFRVHHWELGNEPDVDPTLVDADNQFGCWGDIDDPYYGGEHYGEMLKVVTPAIKAADPAAKVLVGGLLLDRPETTDPGLGKPELFLQGILEAGAAPYFDILPYHAYTSFTGAEIDYDNEQAGPWKSRGGWTLGKARYLHDMLSAYGVDKPLHLNEVALSCNPDAYDCEPPIDPEFFDAQANFLVRTFARDLSEGLEGLVWYTLDGPGWRSGGLLYADDTPRPSYYAYRNLADRLEDARFVQAWEDYGAGIEAYEFITPNRRVHVVWSIDTAPDDILVPQSEYLAAYDRAGTPIAPVLVGDYYQFTAGFSPIYVDLQR